MDDPHLDETIPSVLVLLLLRGLSGLAELLQGALLQLGEVVQSDLQLAEVGPVVSRMDSWSSSKSVGSICVTGSALLKVGNPCRANRMVRQSCSGCS